MKHRLANDIRASLHEALDYAASKRTKAVIHKVMLNRKYRRRLKV